jgi:hypothetical protein
MARVCNRRGYLSYRLQRGSFIHQLQTQRQVWLRVLANRAGFSSRQTRIVSFENAIGEPRHSIGRESCPVIAVLDDRSLTAVSVQGEGLLRTRGDEKSPTVVGHKPLVTLPDIRPEKVLWGI